MMSDAEVWVIVKRVLLATAIVGTLLIVGGIVGCPQYDVYVQAKKGEAALRRAESDRKVAVLEAAAKRHSAVELAQAEIERAKGVAEANRIIGASLANNESYLRYLWISGLEAGSNREVIYVPTEANLPILEAGKR